MKFLSSILLKTIKPISDKRPPDVVISGLDGSIYLRRWWIIPRNRWFNIYLHHFVSSDDDRALHDHPWINMSILIQGDYLEIVPGKNSSNPGIGEGNSRCLLRREGHIYVRGPKSLHRVLLHLDDSLEKEVPVWTLFITGPNVRVWGFQCKRGWVDWKTFTGSPLGTAARGTQRPGIGCGED